MNSFADLVRRKFSNTTISNHNPGTTFYFIPSSEFNAYLKQIKVILSAVKTYRITSDEYDLYSFTVANRDCVDNLGLNFFQKRSGKDFV